MISRSGGDRVEVIIGMVISKVIQEGMSGLQLAEMEFDFDIKSTKTTNVDGGEIRELTDISAVIYWCTGYEGNFGMMDVLIIDSLESEGFEKKKGFTIWLGNRIQSIY